jgi:hypothetical protein
MAMLMAAWRPSRPGWTAIAHVRRYSIGARPGLNTSATWKRRGSAGPQCRAAAARDNSRRNELLARHFTQSAASGSGRRVDGKEGVAGSSPAEGSRQPVGNGGILCGRGDSNRRRFVAWAAFGPRTQSKRVCGRGQARLEHPWGTPNPSVASRSMPDDHAVQAWIRRNEAARAEDRRRDLERSMSERLEEAVRLSRIAAELETNLRREPDVRTG